METVESNIPYNYKTIRVTQSRIDKGLLAIPVSLIDDFPDKKTKVYLSFGDKSKSLPKNFTPYSSSSRECRIGGMRRFYEMHQVEDGDELVIKRIGEKKYQILTESFFEENVLKTEKELDNAQDEEEAENHIKLISEITNQNLKEIALSEFFRLAKKEVQKRKYTEPEKIKKKESTPPSVRKLLGEIYNGKCQVSGFGFIMKNGKPYFEIHHIRPNLGNHLKNLLLVSPNVHAQFTYTSLKEHFDKNGWLRRVQFNDERYSVKQAIDRIPESFKKEIHY
jgi:hypothetical protein